MTARAGTTRHDRARGNSGPLPDWAAGPLPDWAAILGYYALTRVVVLGATATVNTLSLSGARCGDAVARPIEGVSALVGCWDARWFVKAALEGYPSSVPASAESTLAFFPGYPATIAGLHLLGVPALAAALVISLVAGGAAALLVWRLGLAVTDRAAARRAGVLFAAFPGAVVLSWGYSEALAATAAAATLLLLHRRHWWRAGVMAALAGTVRADVAVAVCAACAVAAVLAVRREGDLRALVALVLAPLGALSYLGFLWWHTGSPTTWTRTQSQGWNQHMDWGTHAVNTVARVLVDPVESATRAVSALGVLLVVVAVVALVKRPVPAPWAVFVAVLLVISLTSSQVGFRPRGALLLLPAFVAAGAWVRPGALTVIVTAGVAAQALLVVLWLGAPLIAPP